MHVNERVVERLDEAVGQPHAMSGLGAVCSDVAQGKASRIRVVQRAHRIGERRVIGFGENDAIIGTGTGRRNEIAPARCEAGKHQHKN